MKKLLISLLLLSQAWAVTVNKTPAGDQGALTEGFIVPSGKPVEWAPGAIFKFNSGATFAGSTSAFLEAIGIPTGGSPNQVLAKNSSTNFDMSWKDSGTGSPASGLTGTTLASNVVNSSLTSAAGGTFGNTAFVPYGGGLTSSITNSVTNLGTTGLEFKIVGKSTLAAALNRARSERVAIIGLGDSNQAFNGAGWGYYFAQQLQAAYGCFGSGLLPLGQQYQTQMGQYLSGAGRNNVGTNSGAPTTLDNFAPGAIGSTTVVPSYAYVASGSSVTVQGYGQYSATFNSAHPLNFTGNLKFRFSYGTFSSGSTTFTPSVRMEASPYTVLATGTAINPVTGSNAIVDYTVSLAASARSTDGSYNYSFDPGTVNASLNGPFYGLYVSCENNDMTTGLSYQSLVYHAGGSLLDFNSDLTSFGTTALNEYMRQVKLQLTGSNPSVIFVIEGGLNDRNIPTATPSVGPHPQTPGNGAGAFMDNLQALVTKLTAAWTANGGSSSLITFVFMVSHEISQPDDSSLVAYRNTVTNFVNQNTQCAAIIIPNLAAYEDFNAGGWYYSGSSNYHLNTIGYQTVSQRIANELAPVLPGPITTSTLTVGAGVLLGRASALSGAVEQITPGANLLLTAGAINTASALTGINSITTAAGTDMTLTAGSGKSITTPSYIVSTAAESGANFPIMSKNATNPALAVWNTGASANWGLWAFTPDTSGNLTAQVINDAGNVGSNWLKITRSGTSVSSIQFPGGGTATAASSGTPNFLSIGPTYNDTGTTSRTDLFIQRSGSYGSGTQYFYRLLNGSTVEASMDTAGNSQQLGSVSAGAQIRPGSYTVATLPSAATVGAFAMAGVTDAMTPAIGSAVVGGGAIKVAVMSNGSVWSVYAILP